MSVSAGPPGFQGLSLEQAPPLSLPAAFFLVAPLGMLLTGVLLLLLGTDALSMRLMPGAYAATHLGALLFLGAVMMGALYQTIPVVAGASVPGVRLGFAVLGLLVAGVASLVMGLLTGQAMALLAAPALLGTAALLFLGPVAVALARAPTRSETVTGMRLAVGGFAVVVTIGAGLALVRAGRFTPPGDFGGWVTAHAVLGGCVWVGGLIAALSWQVLPMFYLSQPPGRLVRRGTLAALAFTLIAAPVGVLSGFGPPGVLACGVPAFVAVFLVHPVVTLRAIARRKRRRADASLDFWRLGLVGGLLTAILAVATVSFDAPRLAVALGFCALWGWAGCIVHGMLCRIVPFLVWFHRFSVVPEPVGGSDSVGRQPGGVSTQPERELPTMRSLLPEVFVRRGRNVHAATVVVGLAACLVPFDPLARGAGALLCVNAGLLFWHLWGTLRR